MMPVLLVRHYRANSENMGSLSPWDCNLFEKVFYNKSLWRVNAYSVIWILNSLFDDPGWVHDCQPPPFKCCTMRERASLKSLCTKLCNFS